MPEGSPPSPQWGTQVRCSETPIEPGTVAGFGEQRSLQRVAITPRRGAPPPTTEGDVARALRTRQPGSWTPSTARFFRDPAFSALEAQRAAREETRHSSTQLVVMLLVPSMLHQPTCFRARRASYVSRNVPRHPARERLGDSETVGKYLFFNSAGISFPTLANPLYCRHECGLPPAPLGICKSNASSHPGQRRRTCASPCSEGSLEQTYT